MCFLNDLKNITSNNELPPSIVATLKKFFESYKAAVQENGRRIEEFERIFDTFLMLILQQVHSPYTFEIYHQMVRKPFDYYQFGLDVFRPLVMFEKSKVLGLGQVDRMQELLAKKENVILFANHQTEPDPQVISLLLEKKYSRFAEEMIFVAGHRVTTDPLAAPLSMGRNLLCIYSKKHMAYPPEQKISKQLHNQKVMKKMGQLLAEGGKCIYVAPSGGRDRPDAKGFVDVAPFDPQSIELFWLIAQQSGTPTHFYPLALATYDLVPPPNSVEKELGERRQAHCAPILMAFGEKVDMENFPSHSQGDKRLIRKARAFHIWNLVKTEYDKLIRLKNDDALTHEF